MSLIDQLVTIEMAERVASAIELPDSVMQGAAAVAYAVFGPVVLAFETAIKEHLPELYTRTNEYLIPHEHPFAKRLPFLNPWHVAFSVLCYFVLIIGFAIIGKILGKHSYKLLGIMHNLFLYLLSLYMCVGLMVSARAAGYSLWNNPAGTSEKDYRVAKFVWLFYVSKVPEWMDTVLMLLKHNYHQVSFLHVYHHLTIYCIWWLASFKAPGGEAYYSAMVNSGVHVFMYGYYFLTMTFPTGTVRKVLNNFKFVITKGQMMQFFFNCLQSVYDLAILPAGQLVFSRSLLWLLFWYMISLLALFGNFLRKNAKRPHMVYSPYASPVASPVSTKPGSNGNGAGFAHGKNGKNGDHKGNVNGNGNGNHHTNENGKVKGKGNGKPKKHN